MKILLIVLFAISGAVSSYAQNTPWPTSGSVGIGTMTPTSALDVNGSVTASGLISFIAKAPQGYWGFNHGNFYAGQSGNVYNVGFSSGAIGIFNGSTTAEDIFLFNRNNPGGGYLVLKANNNIGIGTSAPSYALEVARISQNIITAFHDTGSSGIGGSGIAFLNDYTHTESRNWALVQGRYAYGDLAFMQSNAVGGNPVVEGIERVYLAASGNVGIGTTSPRTKFAINGDSNFIYHNGFEFDTPSTTTQNRWLRFSQNGNLFTIQGYSKEAFESATIDSIISLAPSGGNVGIGTTSPSEKLSVKGKIRAQEVIVETTNWSDHVFGDNYQLQSLSEVELHIKTEKHLPGVPSAQEVAEKGVSVGDMQAILLAKIEELTLYQIAQEKSQRLQKEELASLRSEVATLKAENAALKNLGK